MKKCVICGKINGPGSYFKIPNDERRRQQWSAICKIDLKPTAKVCGDHFLQSDFIVGARLSLMPRAVPSVGIVSQTGTHSLNQMVVTKPNASGADDRLHVKKLIEVEQINRASKKPSWVEEFCALPNVSGDDKFHSFTKSGILYLNGLAEVEYVNSNAKTDTHSLNQMEIEIPKASGADFIVEGINCYTQTDNDFIISSVDMENYKLRSEIRKLKNENSKLKKELENANAAIASMNTIFTDSQIRKMGNPEKNVNWRWEDISSCICLHAAGPKAYNHLYQQGFPLPHVSTLHRWARKIVPTEP